MGGSIPGLSRVLSLREAAKRARYRPILGELVDGPQHLAIFLVEATGSRHGPGQVHRQRFPQPRHPEHLL